jgi:hypothetical protein
MAGGGIFLATNLRRIPAKAAAALPPFGGGGDCPGDGHYPGMPTLAAPQPPSYRR